MKIPKINFRDSKVQAGAAVAGVVVAFAAYKRNKNAASPAASSTTADPAGAASALGDANLQSSVYDSLENQIQGLAGVVAQIAARPAPTPSSPAPQPPKKTLTPAQVKNKAAHVPTLAAINLNRKNHNEKVLTAPQAKAKGIAFRPVKPTPVKKPVAKKK